MSNLDKANQIVYKFTMKKIFQKKCQVIYINIAKKEKNGNNVW